MVIVLEALLGLGDVVGNKSRFLFHTGFRQAPAVKAGSELDTEGIASTLGVSDEASRSDGFEAEAGLLGHAATDIVGDEAVGDVALISSHGTGGVPHGHLGNHLSSQVLEGGIEVGVGLEGCSGKILVHEVARMGVLEEFVEVGG